MYKKFEKLLKKYNKTAYRVSIDTGISQSALSEWKHGKRVLRVDKYVTLAKYFGVPVDYFLNDYDE